MPFCVSVLLGKEKKSEPQRGLHELLEYLNCLPQAEKNIMQV